MALFVRHSGSGSQILKLFLCIFPGVLTFTLPMAVLIGVLLGLGRMSADSEIIALTALGIGPPANPGAGCGIGTRRDAGDPGNDGVARPGGTARLSRT